MSTGTPIQPTSGLPLIQKSSRWSSLATRFGSGTIVLLAAAVAYVVYDQWKASVLIKQRLDELRQAGLPHDMSSLIEFRRSRLHSEGSLAWLDLIDLANSSITAIQNKDLQDIWNPQVREGRDLGITAENAGLVAEALDQLAPIIDQLNAISHYPAPIDFKTLTEFEAHGTIYFSPDATAGLGRVLLLEFQYARYLKETSRMLRAIRLIEVLTRAQAQYLFATWGIYQRIQESLEDDLWDLEEIKQLRELVIPATNFIEIINQEAIERRVYALYFDENLAPNEQDLTARLAIQIARLPSNRLKRLEAADQRVERFSTEESLASYLQESNGEEDWFFSQRIAAENHRRLTATALAIKQYQLEFGEWPSRLEQLIEVGLQANEYTMVQGHRFGFQVAPKLEPKSQQNEEDLPSEEFAWLWSPVPSNPSRHQAQMVLQPENQEQRPAFGLSHRYLPVLKIR